MPQVPKRPEMQVKKLVDACSLNVGWITTSYLPAAINKCQYYSFTSLETYTNLFNLKNMLRTLQFPKNLWGNLFLKKLRLLPMGLSTLALQVLMERVGIG